MNAKMNATLRNYVSEARCHTCGRRLWHGGHGDYCANTGCSEVSHSTVASIRGKVAIAFGMNAQDLWPTNKLARLAATSAAHELVKLWEMLYLAPPLCEPTTHRDAQEVSSERNSTNSKVEQAHAALLSILSGTQSACSDDQVAVRVEAANVLLASIQQQADTIEND